MYMLKRMAIRENRQRSKNAAALSRNFFNIVNKKGRNHETSLMMKVVLGTKPLDGINLAPVGLGLVMHNRLPMFGKKIRDIEGLRKIVAKAKELGGE